VVGRVLLAVVNVVMYGDVLELVIKVVLVVLDMLGKVLLVNDRKTASVVVVERVLLMVVMKVELGLMRKVVVLDLPSKVLLVNDEKTGASFDMIVNVLLIVGMKVVVLGLDLLVKVLLLNVGKTASAVVVEGVLLVVSMKVFVL